MDIFTDATATAEAIRTKQVSSREVLDSLVERVETHNRAINAVVALDVERARERAAAADDAAARGEWWASQPLPSPPA